MLFTGLGGGGRIDCGGSGGGGGGGGGSGGARACGGPRWRRQAFYRCVSAVLNRLRHSGAAMLRDRLDGRGLNAMIY